jgi:Domain of unknown function (DUF4203)
MKDIVVGVIAILVGGVFCFRGWLAMRIIIPIWGAFAGFVLGAGAIDAWTGDGFLRTVLGWVVGIALALVFGLFAYLYYEVSVIVAMTFIGFTLGVAMLSALGITWSWVLVLAGIAVGVALAWFSIIADLPMGLLTVLTALGGASVIVTGVMLLVGTIDVDDFDAGITTQKATDNAWWYALYGGLVIAGIVGQLAFRDKVERSLREAWIEQGGRQFRAG